MFISVKIESLRYCCLTPMFVKYDFPFVKPNKRDVTSIDFRDQSFFYRRSKGGRVVTKCLGERRRDQKSLKEHKGGTIEH